MPCQAPYRTGTDIQGGGSGADVGIDSLQPGLWVPAGAPFVQQLSLGLGVVNRGYFCRFVCPRALSISKISFVLNVAATADDPCQAGIYSADGSTLLGASAQLTGLLNSATGPKQASLLAPAQLSPNTLYYAVLSTGAVGGTAAQVVATSMSGFMPAAFGTTVPFLEQSVRDNVFPLPASVTAGFSQNAGAVPIMGLLT